MSIAIIVQQQHILSRIPWAKTWGCLHWNSQKSVLCLRESTLYLRFNLRPTVDTLSEQEQQLGVRPLKPELRLASRQNNSPHRCPGVTMEPGLRPCTSLRCELTMPGYKKGTGMLHSHKAKLRNLLWLSRIWIWKYVCFKIIVTNLSLGLIWSIMCVISWTSIYSEYGSDNINPKSDTTPIHIGNCKSWTQKGRGILSMAPLSKRDCFSCVKKKEPPGIH